MVYLIVPTSCSSNIFKRIYIKFWVLSLHIKLECDFKLQFCLYNSVESKINMRYKGWKTTYHTHQLEHHNHNLCKLCKSLIICACNQTWEDRGYEFKQDHSKTIHITFVTHLSRYIVVRIYVSTSSYWKSCNMSNMNWKRLWESKISNFNSKIFMQQNITPFHITVNDTWVMKKY